MTIDKVVSKEPIPPESSLEVTVKTETRSCARLVLLDEHRRVLLFRHADGHGREFWATPVRLPGETRAGWRREASRNSERIKWTCSLFGTGYSQFRFADRMVSQSEAFFLMTTRFPILVPQTEDVHRRERIKEVRWWSLDEIESSEDVIFPLDLWIGSESILGSGGKISSTRLGPHMSKNRAALTLIELLVVIAVLIGLLVPEAQRGPAALSRAAGSRRSDVVV